MLRTSAVAIAFMGLTFFVSYAEGAEVEQAIAVLENSCLRSARREALFTLRDAKAAAAPAAPVLGRIIASCPTSEEAAAAAEILTQCGAATVPILVELIQNDFESCLMVRRILTMPREDAARAVAALQALCRDKPEYITPVAIAIRGAGGIEKTSEFTHELLDRFPGTSVHLIAYLAAATREDSLCKQIESRGGPLAAYLAANIRERWREQDWLGTVTGELPARETKRRQQAQAELQRLAKEATPEFLELLRQNHSPCDDFIKIGILEELVHHAEIVPQQLYDVVVGKSHERGSALDLLLRRHVDESLVTRPKGADGLPLGMGGTEEGSSRYAPGSFWGASY